MFAVVKAITTIMSLMFFIDRAGRRKLLLISSVGTSLALWYIGGFVTAAHVDLGVPEGKSIGGWVALVCVYLYAVSPCFSPYSTLTSHLEISLCRSEKNAVTLA
jgi:hypothetical protein